MTYKDLIYLNVYLQAFYDEIKEHDNTINEVQVNELLYRINYNSFEIQFYKTALIKIEVEAIESISDKIDYSVSQFKKCKSAKEQGKHCF
jgi:competence transcription factor ComK